MEGSSNNAVERNTSEDAALIAKMQDGFAGSSKRTSLAALPSTVAMLVEQKKTKQKATLNDMIDALHLSLWEDPEYQKFLDAVYNEQAVEGSTACDDVEASRMLRKKAREQGNQYIAGLKLATIMKGLHVVLRRYGISRKERREA